MTNANVPAARACRPAGYINKKVMESAGDMGVPRIAKKAPTMTREFALSSARSTSARKQVDVPDELSRPVFSSFGKVVSKPAPKPTKPVSKLAPKQAAAPKEAAPKPVEEVAAVIETPAPTEADEWIVVPDASRVPTGKRRVFLKDNLPSYFAAEDEEEDEADEDFIDLEAGMGGEVAKGVSRRRVWGKDSLPTYFAPEDEEEDDEGDEDYAPPKEEEAVDISEGEATIKAYGSIAHASMAAYVVDVEIARA